MRLSSASMGRNESVRRVAARLTVQTVGLVLVMLIVLEIVVYVITQQALTGSLETTLETRAQQADPTVCGAFHLNCGGGAGPRNPAGAGSGPHTGGSPGPGGGRNGGSGPGGPGGPDFFAPVAGPSDANAAYVDLQLHVVHADGVLGNHVPAMADVRGALRSGRSQCCDVRTYEGEQYLVYTAPLRAGSTIVGAVQTTISEHQYAQTMSLLLRALIVVALLGLVGSAAVSAALVGRALLPIRLAMQRQRDFVADAAHELRTPLAIQRTVAEIGTADPTVEELEETVEQMLSENRHLTRLVEDLSLLARTDTDAVSIEREPMDLSGLLTQTADEIRYLTMDKGITLEADVPANVTAYGDVLRLRQLFLILLDNALKHTPAGGEVRVQLTLDGGRSRLDVSDSGEGIPPRDLPRIFDRFYRADEARTGEGTGLGLAIAKWIVEAHGGHIQAGNMPGRGAVFTVFLPLSRAPVPAVKLSDSPGSA
jgi:signal transduction histidine kinase